MLEEMRNGLLTAAAFNAHISKNYDSVPRSTSTN
jgi:hypothetical protein